jgi:hypothetical protein
MFGGNQGAALGLPALAEGVEYPVAPVAAWYQGGRPAHAIGPCPACCFARLVFGGEAELEQLRRAFLAWVAVVQGQGGDG